MDISSVSAPPVNIPSQPSAASPGPVQTTASAPGAAPANSAAGTGDAASSDSLAQAVKQVNDSFTQMGQNLYASFERDKATGINVVKIVDQKTNETISQLPIKEMVAFAQALEHPQGMRGKLIHTTA